MTQPFIFLVESSKVFSDNCLATGGGGGRTILTLATVSTHRRPRGVHLPLTSSCLADLCLRDREKERERKRRVKKRVLLPFDLSPGPKRGAGLCPPRSVVLFLPLLFQLSGYSPKPKGVFNGGLGITGPTVNSSEVKGLGRCPLSPPCRILPWLSELLGDVGPAPRGSPFAACTAQFGPSPASMMPWYHVHCKKLAFSFLCQHIIGQVTFSKGMAQKE